MDNRSGSGPHRETSRPAIWAALLTVYLVWGSTYLAIRFAVETLPPFLMAGVRFLVAGAVLYAWSRQRGGGAPPFSAWRAAGIVGLLMLVGGNGGVSWAEQRVASGLAALIVATAPLWMVLLDAIRPGGRWPGWQNLGGVALGFAGVVLLVAPSRIAGNGLHVDPLGAAVLIAAAFLWSAGSLYARTAALPTSALLATAMEMLAGGGALILLGVASGEAGQVSFAAISARSVAGLIYLIVFGSWVGLTAYIWLLRVAPTALVSTYAYVNPLVAIALGTVLAGEPVTPRLLAAAAVIVGSVALTTAVGARQPAPATRRPRLREEAA